MDLMPKVRRNNPPEIEEFIEEEETPKQVIKQGEIFQGLTQENEDPDTTPTKEEKNEETGESNPNFIYEEEPTPKPQKKKRVMTEAQKEGLARAREKALATRRANAKQKKEIKELKELQKNQELNKLRESVLGDVAPPPKVKKVEYIEPEPAPAPAPPPEPVKPKERQYTRAELIQAQSEAVLQYETIRLEKKSIKKQQKEADDYLRHRIDRAVNPQPRFRGLNNNNDYNNFL